MKKCIALIGSMSTGPKLKLIDPLHRTTKLRDNRLEKELKFETPLTFRSRTLNFHWVSYFSCLRFGMVDAGGGQLGVISPSSASMHKQFLIADKTAITTSTCQPFDIELFESARHVIDGYTSFYRIHPFSCVSFI